MLTGTVTAPTRAQPDHHLEQTDRVGQRDEDPVAGRSPAATSADAYRPARSSSAPKVTDVEPCRNATRSRGPAGTEVGLGGRR